ncbi:hypothetical protein CYMTET_13678 [Cymbomonas tetramitiformis]|uniref:Uncharacterized protein n=1 Tax=Cymbomonas tetramitiformis TaxID=36881 RepID=A0AAE0GI43_9CHLO|nr:hypothetical protein CYMTET_13678 [Cymbomonas tetramitiformis]
MDETGARLDREGDHAREAGCAERQGRGFADTVCLALAREPPRGMETNPETQEELECNRGVMFDIDHPEVASSDDTMENGKLKVPKKIDTRLIDKSFFQEAREEGVVCYEPCGGLCAGLEMLLRCGVKVKKYLYQDISKASQAVARTRCLALSRRHPDLLPAAAIHLEQLPSNLEDTRLNDLVRAGALSGDRPPDRYASDILQQGWKPRKVVSGDRKPHHIANVLGEPMRVLPTILATQNSRAFRAPRAGTVVRADDVTEEGESREVNLDEKAIAMSYSASELRVTGGMSDEELAGIVGLAMDRIASGNGSPRPATTPGKSPNASVTRIGSGDYNRCVVGTL